MDVLISAGCWYRWVQHKEWRPCDGECGRCVFPDNLNATNRQRYEKNKVIENGDRRIIDSVIITGPIS